MKNLAAKEYWGEDGGYYNKKASDLRKNPLPLPSQDRAFFRKLEKYFLMHLPREDGLSLLEIGCGCSVMLPYFKKIFKYEVSGIDYDRYAADLAAANLEGYGIKGNVYCRDVFDLKSNKELMASFDIIYSHGVLEHFDNAIEAVKAFGGFLKTNGYIVTCIPNFRGINYLIQGFVDAKMLGMHILHNKGSLRSIHERAGFTTLLCEYIGVYDGWLTEGSRCKSPWKRKIHWFYCYVTNVLVDRILRYTRFKSMPESRWMSPYILYIGRKTNGTQ